MAPVYKVQELANGNCTISKVQVPPSRGLWQIMILQNILKKLKVLQNPCTVSMFHASSEKSEHKLLAHYDPPNYLHLQGFNCKFSFLFRISEVFQLFVFRGRSLFACDERSPPEMNTKKIVLIQKKIICHWLIWHHQCPSFTTSLFLFHLK